jgi:hypothetical protein
MVYVRFSFFEMVLNYKRTTNKDHDGENCIICGTMVKVAKLGSGAPYAGSGRIKTVLRQIHLVTYYSSGGHRNHHSTPPNVGFQV